MVLEYGKGKISTPRCATTTVNPSSASDSVPPLNRACKWLATSKVTTEIPANFSTEDKVSVVNKK